MNEDEGRRVRTLGLPEVDLLDLGRSIGEALWRTDDRGHLLIVGSATTADDLAVEGIDILVISLVELVLIHGEPDERALLARLRRRRAALRRRRAGPDGQSAGGGAGQQRAARERALGWSLRLHDALSPLAWWLPPA